MDAMQELRDEQWDPEYRLICRKHNYSVPPAANGIYFDTPCPRCEYEMEYDEPTLTPAEIAELEEEKRRDWASDVDWAVE